VVDRWTQVCDDGKGGFIEAQRDRDGIIVRGQAGIPARDLEDVFMRLREVAGIPPPATGLWCFWCVDEPVRRKGRATVHFGTGMPECPDGEHVARATSASPQMRASAQAVRTDYGDRRIISTDLGSFCGYPATGTPAGMPEVTVEAATEAEFRKKLDEAEAIVEAQR
jgi:hypothetical protein